MERQVALYLHLHQPYRLARFRYVDLGRGRPYFDEPRNRSIFEGIAARSYRPALAILAERLASRPEFRLTLSLTGTFLEQAEAYAPDLLATVAGMAATGRLAILGETYHHSLAFLLDGPELAEEVRSHARAIRDRFGRAPRVLRMTELAYSDAIARFAAGEGFAAVAAEGWEGWLGAASPTHVYAAAPAPAVRLLLRHYRLSDDIGFRFSDPAWSERPLTPEKFAGWIAATPGEFVGLFLDFETFGEHHPASSGILDFLAALPAAVAERPGLRWATLEEAADLPPRGSLAAPRTVTWADAGRDLGAWLGNDLQRSAFEAAKKLGRILRTVGDPALLATWRRLLTSDHFYYLYLGGAGADRGVHDHFNAYGNPFDAYANYMNVLTDLRRRALDRLERAPAAAREAPSGGKGS